MSSEDSEDEAFGEDDASGLDEHGWDSMVDEFLLSIVEEAREFSPRVDWAWVSCQFIETLQPDESQVEAALERFSPRALLERWIYLERCRRDNLERSPLQDSEGSEANPTEDAEIGQEIELTQPEQHEDSCQQQCLKQGHITTNSATPTTATTPSSHSNEEQQHQQHSHEEGEQQKQQQQMQMQMEQLQQKQQVQQEAQQHDDQHEQQLQQSTPSSASSSIPPGVAVAEESAEPARKDRVLEAMQSFLFGRPKPGKVPQSSLQSLPEAKPEETPLESDVAKHSNPSVADRATSDDEREEVAKETPEEVALTVEVLPQEQEDPDQDEVANDVSEPAGQRISPSNGIAGSSRTCSGSSNEALRKCLEELRWHGEALRRCALNAEEAAPLCVEAAERRKALLWQLGVGPEGTL
eukprot:TRINITY_DN63894_c0_g1_i1.p1 TRINITY_DN63894_c0_g1~~TRINITY_DN63894_c0_g1_i1.p1  ORF type:complete len:410 (+),score=125.13 TRINITY_DN63894_c0_g1_i1:62-1291(+)